MKKEALIALKILLKSRYNFYLNNVTGYVEVRSGDDTFNSPINDLLINSIWQLCVGNSIQVTKADIYRLLESAFVPAYNPFVDYLATLQPWDGTDYIQQLVDTVETTNTPYWSGYFRKWIVGMVGSTMLNVNSATQPALILAGKPKLGKRDWLSNLVPSKLKSYYYSGSIGLNNKNSKDTLVRLLDSMLIHVDGLDGATRKDADLLEGYIKGAVRVKKPNDRYCGCYRRRASLTGSVNAPQFLDNITDSHLFLCFEATKIWHRHGVDMDQVYAQALHLYRESFEKWPLTHQDDHKIAQENELLILKPVANNRLPSHFDRESVIEEISTGILSTTDLLYGLRKLAKLSIIGLN